MCNLKKMAYIVKTFIPNSKDKEVIVNLDNVPVLIGGSSNSDQELYRPMFVTEKDIDTGLGKGDFIIKEDFLSCCKNFVKVRCIKKIFSSFSYELRNVYINKKAIVTIPVYHKEYSVEVKGEEKLVDYAEVTLALFNYNKEKTTETIDIHWKDIDFLINSLLGDNEF